MNISNISSAFGASNIFDVVSSMEISKTAVATSVTAIVLASAALYCYRNSNYYLLEACRKSSYRLARFALIAGADVNGIASRAHLPRDYKSTLLISCEKGDLPLVNLLLQQGASWYLTTNRSYPIHVAVKGGHEKVVEALLQHHSAFHEAVDGDGNTSLHLAVDCKFSGIVSLLLAKGASVNKKNAAGNTALHVACETRDPELVRKILQGVKPNEENPLEMKNKNEETPFHFVSHLGDVQLLVLLLGALENSRGKKSLLNIPNFNLDTPVHIAVAKGHLEAVQKLVEAGADFRKINKQGETPLELANRLRHEKVVQFLKEEDVRRPVPAPVSIPRRSASTNLLEQDPSPQ